MSKTIKCTCGGSAVYVGERNYYNEWERKVIEDVIEYQCKTCGKKLKEIRKPGTTPIISYGGNCK